MVINLCFDFTLNLSLKKLPYLKVSLYSLVFTVFSVFTFQVSLNDSVCCLKRGALKTGVAQGLGSFLPITGADGVSSRHFELTLWRKWWHLVVRLPR